MERLQGILMEPKKPNSCHNWKHNRGEVDENGQLLRKSSELFLSELKERVDDAYAQVFQFVFMSIQESDIPIHEINPQSRFFELILQDIYLAIQEATSTLLLVVPEIRRLQRRQDLYPSADSANRFLHSVKTRITINHRRTLSAAKKMHQSRCWERIHCAERQIILAIQHPTYRPCLKPWQQFLIDGAPGSGFNARDIFYGRRPDSLAVSSLGSSSFRILPPGAVCLLREWHTRARETERKCRETVVPLKPSTGHSQSSTTQVPQIKEPLPSSSLGHEIVRFSSSPNIWFPHQPDISKFAGPVDPGQLSLMIDTIEGYDEQRLYNAPQALGAVVRTQQT